MDNEGKYGIEIRPFLSSRKHFYPKNTRLKKSQDNRNTESKGYPCLVEVCQLEISLKRLVAKRSSTMSCTLRKHAKVHAVRKFSCERCGRTFAERTKLNRHMLTHTGERAFRV
ncbi:zinc finger, C2H2 type [Cooperia oncophora]